MRCNSSPAARLVRNYKFEAVTSATKDAPVGPETGGPRGGADAARCAMTDKLDWRVAIIGYDLTRWTEYLSAYARQPGEAQRLMDDGRRKTHFVNDIDDETRRSFYQALLKIEWLPVKIRSAIMSELGLSLQKWKRDNERARTETLKFLISECKARMRENGERPRGGIHDAAVAEIAAKHGMEVGALRQRITRLKKRSRK